MKSFLQDVVAHTHSLGFLPFVKVTTGPSHVEIDAQSEDRAVMMFGKTKELVNGLTDEFVFGLPNLNKLDLHLKCPEYKKDAFIELKQETRDGEIVPTGLHFNNVTRDYENNYRFMNRVIIEDKVIRPKYKVQPIFELEFTPMASSVTKLKFQAAAHTEEPFFQAVTVNGNLVFKLGDESTHTGSFIFQPNVTNVLNRTWSWSVQHLLSILGLDGDMTIKISDMGLLEVVVDSGLATYTYLITAQTK